MFEWVLSYFQENKSSKAPLYLQHQGENFEIFLVSKSMNLTKNIQKRRFHTSSIYPDNQSIDLKFLKLTFGKVGEHISITTLSHVSTALKKRHSLVLLPQEKN